MGNDGGSIPDRRDLVRNKPKAEQADKANQTRAIWYFCALSKRKLQEPIVSCALGKLYNRDSVLEYLLDNSSYGDGEEICGHIRSRKDIQTLTLTPNPVISTSNVSEDVEVAPFVCPLNLKEMNGSQPFVYLSTCGCVFSQAGLKTVTASSSPKEKVDDPVESSEEAVEMQLCPQCAKKYTAEDIIPLNPSPEDQLNMRFALERKRSAEPPKKKKSKKRKLGETTDEVEAPPTKKTVASVSSSVAAVSRAVADGLVQEEAKRKANMSAAVKSLYGEGRPKKKETFMTVGTFTRYA